MSLFLEIKATEKGMTVTQLSDKYKKNIKGMEQQSKTSGKNIIGGAKQVRMAYLAVTAAVAGTVLAFKSAISSTAQHRDSIAKMSRATGIAVETLSALEFAADRSGTSIEAVDRGFRNLIRRMQDAKDGLMEGVRAFDALNVDVLDSNKNLRDGTQVFFDTADAISKLSDKTQQAAMAQEIFGRSGLALVPLFEQGAAGIREYIREAERLGIVISAKQAKQAEDYQDSVTDLGFAFRALKEDAIGPLLPKLTDLFNLLTADNLNAWDKLGAVVSGGVGKIAAELSALDEMIIRSGQVPEWVKRYEEEKAKKGQPTQWEKDLMAAREASAKALYNQRIKETLQLEESRKIYEGTLALEEKSLTVSGEEKEIQFKIGEDLRYQQVLINQGILPGIEMATGKWHDVKNELGEVKSITQQIGFTIETQIVGALRRVIFAGQGVGDTFKNLLASALDIGLTLGVKAILPFSKGGVIPSYQSGGVVGRPRMIMAHEGEGVVNQRGMAAIGAEGLARINQGNTFGDWNINVVTNTFDERYVRNNLLPMLRSEIERGELPIS